MTKKKQEEEQHIITKIALLSFSGGVLSSTYLMQLLNNKYYEKVYAIFFDYENSYEIETLSAEEIIKFVSTNEQYKNKLVFEKLKIRVTDKILENLNSVENSELVKNKELFLTMDAMVTLAENLFDRTEKQIDLHIGMNFDMDDDVIDEYDIAINYVKERLLPNKIEIKNEYKNYNKQDALRDGVILTSQAGLDFNEFYKRTTTVPATIKIGNKFYVDIENPQASTRVLAFHQLKMVDPIKYVKGEEILTWDEAVAYFGGNSSIDEFGNTILEEVKYEEPTIQKEEVNIKVSQVIETGFVPESPHKKRHYVSVTQN